LLGEHTTSVRHCGYFSSARKARSRFRKTGSAAVLRLENYATSGIEMVY
jgi:hypothetical protein